MVLNMSIADFLFTPGQQRMLAPLLLRPDQSFKLTELLGFFHSGRGAGQLQVKKLLDAGVLAETRMGNQRRIRVNERFPLYPELRSICLKSFGLAEQIKDALAKVAPDIQEAFVFGSVARGEDRPDSDIDIMIIGNLDLVPVLDAIAPVEKNLGRTINVNLYSPTEWNDLKERDSVVSKIIAGATIRLLPNATTT